MRNYKKSEYTKTIGIKAKKLIKIDKWRGKKSKAGKLNEIIEYYEEKVIKKDLELKKNYSEIGNGEPCKKCGGKTERRKRNTNADVKKGKYYFTEWDYCKECKHTQHYKKYKIKK